MKHSLILTHVFFITLHGVTMAHNLEGEYTVNKFGLPYTECVRESTKNVDRDLAVRWCTCVFKQMGLHDHEDNPDQEFFLPLSKHSGHAIKVCKTRHARGEL